MTRYAYLTIDDSPSSRTNDLVDFLARKDIPALFFCRGDFMEASMDSIIRAIEKGFTIGNHSYSHTPAGQIPPQQMIDEIAKTEDMIAWAYRAAGRPPKGKFFRFPYVDRGDGDRVERRFDDLVKAAAAGEDVSLTKESPHPERVVEIQNYLRSQGYSQPFPRVRHPLYNVPEIALAADCLFTCSTFDWMLLERHLGRQRYKTVDELQACIDQDPFIADESIIPVYLVHDSAGIHDVTKALISHLLDKGTQFLEFETCV